MLAFHVRRSMLFLRRLRISASPDCLVTRGWCWRTRAARAAVSAVEAGSEVGGYVSGEGNGIERGRGWRRTEFRGEAFAEVAEDHFDIEVTLPLLS